ncbi:unnamed protein product [Moneuplotes crassus]|uniref:Calcineurin-like phosphoesterase domain-containing protein n=1 Tax=Euplotes crassus TaxID=5936 RepID=A0AAD1UIT8_EUPCR|nr:unnamed protein product [Moneuplotes crassus]
MKICLSFVLSILLATTLAGTYKVKVGIINDLHYEPFYQTGSDIQRYCRSDNSPLKWITGYTQDNASPFGEYRCDAPKRLINLMLDKLDEIDPDIDVLLVSGDFIAHGIAVEITDKVHDQYQILKDSISEVFLEMINKKFPNAIVLPAIGNNDIKYHYVSPQRGVTAPDYYPFMYDLIFEKMDGNKNIGTQDMRDTFTKFGGFRYDYSDDISFISFNSLYYNNKVPSKDTQIKKAQFDWLANTIDQEQSERKFVIFFHVYPGVYIIKSPKSFWEQEAQLEFNRIIQRNSHKIILVTGAHSHYADVKVFFDKEFTIQDFMNPKETEFRANPVWALLVTPSISPVFTNNPGVTHLNLNDGFADNITWTFLELNRYPSDESEAQYNTFSLEQQCGIFKFTPEQVANFIKSLIKDKYALYKYLAHKIGFQGENIVNALLGYKELGTITFKDESEYFCSLLNNKRIDYYI